MWETLGLVDWKALTHAYGAAGNVPDILQGMISGDTEEHRKGWYDFWGSLNHQGDFYDSTVAVVPFLIEAAMNPVARDRDGMLGALRNLWESGPEYGGDALLPDPPGGIDLPTPLCADRPAGEAAEEEIDDDQDNDDEEGVEEFDISRYRRMDLFAWQTGRAIMAGRADYRKLLNEPVNNVAAAAAVLLMRWREDRPTAKAALVRRIDAGDDDAIARAGRILELGVYGEDSDLADLARWVAPNQPPAVRGAAALAWAYIIAPRSLPKAAGDALHATSAPDCDAFAKMPRGGVYPSPAWHLPVNAAGVALRLADNRDDEMRWRAVQAMEVERVTASHLSIGQIVPLLVGKLSDSDHHVRQTAAAALAQRHVAACDADAAVIPALMAAVGDVNVTVSASAARSLAAMLPRLSADQRAQVLSGIDEAQRRFRGKKDSTVFMGNTGLDGKKLLKVARDAIAMPRERDVLSLLADWRPLSIGQDKIPGTDFEQLLSQAHDAAPRRFVATLIDALGGEDRSAAIGAAEWLVKLGPAASCALPALEAMANGTLDDHAKWVAKTSAGFIRESLTVPAPPLESDAEGAGGPPPVVSQWAERLNARDIHQRARAARALAELAATTPAVGDIADLLIALLGDDADAIVGISGAGNIDGRVHFWRRERRSPRAWAIRALLRCGKGPPGNAVLSAMVAESLRLGVQYAGSYAEPEKFTLREWRCGGALAGGEEIAESAVRAVRQSCRQSSEPLDKFSRRERIHPARQQAFRPDRVTAPAWLREPQAPSRLTHHGAKPREEKMVAVPGFSGFGFPVLTLNRRDFTKLHKQSPAHAGIIACTADADYAGQANRIHSSITKMASLAGELIRVNRRP